MRSRKKAGRKPGSMGKNNRRKSTVTLPPAWWVWLNEQPDSQSVTIEKALIKYKAGKAI